MIIEEAFISAWWQDNFLFRCHIPVSLGQNLLHVFFSNQLFSLFHFVQHPPVFLKQNIYLFSFYQKILVYLQL